MLYQTFAIPHSMHLSTHSLAHSFKLSKRETVHEVYYRENRYKSTSAVILEEPPPSGEAHDLTRLRLQDTTLTLTDEHINN